MPDTDFTARLPFACAGVILVGACLLFRSLAGWRTALLAMALLIISPTVTYYSRFAREDIVMTAVLAGVAGAGALYLKTRRLRWLNLTWACIVVGYCTKENSYVNFFLICAFLLAVAAIQVVRNPRQWIRAVLVRYLPLTRLLLLLGLFSFFMLFYVAVDSRVGPNGSLRNGLAKIIRHSVAINPGDSDAALKQSLAREHGFFRAQGRDSVRHTYMVVAFVIPVLALGVVEGLAEWVRRRRLRRSALTAVLGWIGYGAGAVWLVDFALWANGFSGGDFLDGLRGRLIWGWMLLSGLALLSVLPAMLSTAARRRTGRGWRRWRVLMRLWRPGLVGLWALAAQVVVAVAVFCILFSSLGTNVPAGLRAGLYDYIAYWFRQQTGEFRIWGPWWYYLPRLALYETAALALTATAGTALLIRWMRNRADGGAKSAAGVRKDGPSKTLIAFWAWLTVSMIAMYALLNEKVGWLAIYQAFSLNLLAAFLAGRWLAQNPGRPRHWPAALVVVAALLFTLWQHSLAVHLYPDSPTEPMAYVTTSREYMLECQRIEEAQWSALRKKAEPPAVALSGDGVWPAAWYLRRVNTGVFPFDEKATVQLLDDNPTNRRRLALSRDFQWRVTSVPVRGWWFSFGEGLPARLNLAGNLAAFVLNADNDHRAAFPPEQPYPGARYPVGFAKQIIRFVMLRVPWYPPTGTRVLFAWKTKEPADVKGNPGWLEGLDRDPRECPVVTRIGREGKEPEALSAPRGLALLPNGDLAVADSGNGRIQIFHPDGRWVRTLGEGILNSSVTGPCGVTATPNGLYVADTWNHAIRRFSFQGELIATCYAVPLESPGEHFYGPRGITAVGEGDDVRIYVADTGNNRIVVLNGDLVPLRGWGEPGAGPGQFNEPVGIAVDGAGWVYVADTGNGRIQRFTAEGEYAGEYLVFLPSETERVAVEPNLTVLPDGRRLAMTWSTQGLVVILDLESGRAWPWKPAGPRAEPVGILVAADWSIYTTDRRSSSILCLSDRIAPTPGTSTHSEAPSP